MEKVIKQRTDQNVVMAIIAVIIMPVVVLFIWGVRTGNLTSMVKSLVSPVHPIEIGTDLSQYKGKKVSCSAINISYQVVALYHRNNPEKKLYADSYLVTDSNYENPTLIFFPEEKFEQLKDMYEKTWSSMYGEPELVYPIKVEGFVRQLTGSDIEFYEKAMNNLYGEDSYTHGDNIYYIDDEDVYMKNLHREDIYIFWICLVILELIMVSILISMIVKSKKCPQIIQQYLQDHNMSMYRLDQMFSSTEEVIENFWISPELTVAYDSMHFVILNNAELARISCDRVNGKRVSYNFTFYTRDLEKRGPITVTHNDEILNYYKKNCPNIMIV